MRKITWYIYIYPGVNILPIEIGRIKASENSTEMSILKEWEGQDALAKEFGSTGYKAFNHELLP